MLGKLRGKYAGMENICISDFSFSWTEKNNLVLQLRVTYLR